ncbi:MAG: hypothetical protein LLG04_07640 [Parachlamydia sp.]|nr:hypothetical protein [Parachlamydia sp.]
MHRATSILLSLSLIAGPLCADQIRAAFDVGSGQTKITVAVVDESTGRPQQVLFSEETVVLVGHDFKKSKNGILSDAILSELKNVLVRYCDIAKGLGAEEMAGVATAVFRESKNGGEFVQKVKDELGIGLKLISQAEEGRLGFLTAVAASGRQSHEVIAWDSGGGSFQITTEGEAGLCVYEGPLGASKVLAAIVEKVQGRDFTKVQTANPASLDDIKALHKIIQNVLKPPAKDLQVKLANPAVEVIAIGGPYCPFQIATLAIGNATFNKQQVWQAIEKLAGLTDEGLAHFPEPEMVLPRLTLVHAVMDHFGISQVRYTPTVGSTLGILMTVHFWEGALLLK